MEGDILEHEAATSLHTPKNRHWQEYTLISFHSRHKVFSSCYDSYTRQSEPLYQTYRVLLNRYSQATLSYSTYTVSTSEA